MSSLSELNQGNTCDSGLRAAIRAGQRLCGQLPGRSAGLSGRGCEAVQGDRLGSGCGSLSPGSPGEAQTQGRTRDRSARYLGSGGCLPLPESGAEGQGAGTS